MELEARVCKACGEQFIPKSNNQRYCKKQHYKDCPVCGKPVPVSSDRWYENPVACSQACKFQRVRATSQQKYGMNAPGNNPEAREKAKRTSRENRGTDYAMQSPDVRDKSRQTMLERYGVDNIAKRPETSEKRKQTCIERYGATSNLNSPEGIEKVHKTMIERYGAPYPMQVPELRERSQSTCLERYGVPHVLSSPQVRELIKETMIRIYGAPCLSHSEEIRSRIRKTCLKRYGVDNPSKCPEIVEKIKDTFFERYGTRGVMNVPEIHDRIVATTMKRHGVPYGIMTEAARRSSGCISKINVDVARRLDLAGIPYTIEFSIGKRSYDFMIQGTNTLLEINPSYTNNLLGNHWSKEGIPFRYHIEKTELAEANGYRCIHIWDWDSIPRIINELKRAKTISFDDCVTTLMDDTIQISYRDRIMQTVSFDIIESVLTINSITTEPGISLTDNYVNLIAWIGDNIDVRYIDIMVDRSKYTGSVWNDIGAELICSFEPSIIWSKGKTAITSELLQSTLGSDYDEELVLLLMVHSKFLPIPDCGYDLYRYSLTVC